MHLDSSEPSSSLLLPRERALSWASRPKGRRRQSNKSLHQVSLLPTLLDGLALADDDKSSVVSDMSSFHGVQEESPSLHSLDCRLKRSPGQLLQLLDQIGPRRPNKSECQSLASCQSLSATPQRDRRIFRIPSEPVRILDTPGVDDNYYVNVLGWSSRDAIGVSLDNVVYLLHCSGTAFDQVYEAEGDSPTSLAFDPSGDRVAVGNDRGRLMVFDAATLQQVSAVSVCQERVGCLEWGGSGLLSGSKRGGVCLMDPRAREQVVSRFSGHQQEVVSLKGSPFNDDFASGGNDNQALVWSLRKSAPLWRLQHKAAVRGLAWSFKTAGLLATGGGYSDHLICTYDVGRSAVVDARATDGQVCSLAFSRLTNDLVSSHGLPHFDLSVWRTKGLKRVVQLTGHEARPLHICLSPDGTTLVSLASDETMRFWRLFEGPSTANPTSSLSPKEQAGEERSEAADSSKNDPSDPTDPPQGEGEPEWECSDFENDYGDSLSKASD